VQGSVRRSGERIRVSVHLVDAANGNHLWAERYDRQLADVFAMQDEVSGAIAATIEGRISAGAAARARRMPTEHMAAYDFVLQAREHMARYDMSAAEPLLNKALSIDPSYAEAHARRAFVVMYRYWSNQDNALLVEARRHAEHALEADETEEWAHFAMANVHLSLREFDIAEKHFERGMSINPNNVTGRIMYAEWLNYVGRFDDALEHLAEVVLRDPFPPDWYWEIRGTALFQLRRYDEAVRSFRRISAVQPWNSVYLAAALAHAGHFAEAAKQVTMQRMGTPAVSLMKLAARDPYKETEPTEHLLAGLRKAQQAAEAARQ
jgi:Tfp pilus assembly protein PilF